MQLPCQRACQHPAGPLRRWPCRWDSVERQQCLRVARAPGVSDAAYRSACSGNEPWTCLCSYKDRHRHKHVVLREKLFENSKPPRNISWKAQKRHGGRGCKDRRQGKCGKLGARVLFYSLGSTANVGLELMEMMLWWRWGSTCVFRIPPWVVFGEHRWRDCRTVWHSLFLYFGSPRSVFHCGALFTFTQRLWCCTFSNCPKQLSFSAPLIMSIPIHVRHDLIAVLMCAFWRIGQGDQLFIRVWATFIPFLEKWLSSRLPIFYSGDYLLGCADV